MSTFPKRFIPSILILAALALTTLLFTRAAPLFPETPSQVSNSAVSNLLPSTPTGWDGPAVPAFITGTHTTETLYAGLGIPTYFDWAILNDSSTPITTSTVTCLHIDGESINTWNIASFGANTFQTIEDFPYALPEPGTYTLTLIADCTNLVAESNEADNTWTGEFTWNPYVSIIISDEHGFDKCDIATTSQMNTWWSDSPYFYSNIYMGGIARACPNTGLNDNWVRNVVEKGWNLIPTWVGPQAPCSAFNNRFSPNPGTAREQGRREADAAYQVAQELGLIPPGSPTILYYDLEAFPNQKLCRQAAGQFLSGWTDRLHELGQLSGIYGAGCGSYPVDWPTLPAPPDAVWLAHWIFTDYDPLATVWNVLCVPNTLWDDNERIRQYAGGHNETWGGVTLNIDSNVAEGPVVGINPSLQAEPPELSAPVRDMQLLAPDQGWILQGDRLLWKNPGNPFTDITPPETIPVAAFFLNLTTGWIATPNFAGESRSFEEPISLSILHTPDQGQTWQSAGTLTLPTPDAPGNIWIHFIDDQTGWVAVQLPSSSNFSLGSLFHTTDGGQSWKELPLPIGAPVYFVNAQTGWTTGGANGDELYVTHDGGESWSVLALTPSSAWYSLPTFVNGIGILAATLPGETDSRVAFFTSADNGQTWQSAAEISVPSPGPFSISIVDATTWIIANPATGILVMQDAGKTAIPLPLTGVQAVDFLSAEMGWAITSSNSCTGTKGKPDFACNFQSALESSTNGGESWITITPD